MATKRMLVDAIHPEETRIVVTNGNKLEEFDFESATRRQLRGNIYLAKVTRVEPSLQAAFIEYGGNRHGFLAFSEIHPDYYQIPIADREALLRDEEDHDDDDHDQAPAPAEAGAEEDSQSTDAEEGDEASHIEQAPANNEPVESIGGGDALEDAQERRRPAPRRHDYKIQEVIKRRQVMLVQVVKEERGNKGAALTTYLSLAGRYSVLMPNTARGGGISRKITNAADRKRLKEIVGDLEVPQGQGIILRTAGASRTKAEVKRDFEYLQRLWENVRTLTLKSQAPCLVYEEGSLIKRTIRDLYSKEIDELLVAGDDAYREAKDFMRMIMPSHAKNVQLYKEDAPLFSKYGVENQLDQMQCGGSRPPQAWPVDQRPRPDRCRALHPQFQARHAERARSQVQPLRHHRRGRSRRSVPLRYRARRDPRHRPRRNRRHPRPRRYCDAGRGRRARRRDRG